MRPAATACLLGITLLGCGIGRHAGRGADKAPPPTNVAGVWEGLFRSSLGQDGNGGDTLLERHAWRLEQDGARVQGFYVVELTAISGDGRPYLCNQETRFTTLLRFDLLGHATAEAIVLEEVGPLRAQGACRPGYRTPAHYRAVLTGDVLTVTGAGRTHKLYKRAAADGPESLADLSFAAENAETAPAATFPELPAAVAADETGLPAAELAGYWVWENQVRLPNGDIKREREEWHLQQDGLQLVGFYDRAVEQQSTDGQVYRCNGEDDFRVVTRYNVTGLVSGQRFVLREQTFEILEGGPCDDGQRRLDAYQGEARAGELHLVWGVGRQILKRARPELPTQRF